MDHIVSVSLDAVTLKQLDDLRRAHPTVPNRTQVIQRLDLGSAWPDRSDAGSRECG